MANHTVKATCTQRVVLNIDGRAFTTPAVRGGPWVSKSGPPSTRSNLHVGATMRATGVFALDPRERPSTSFASHPSL
jgi:hypothetical protein